MDAEVWSHADIRNGRWLFAVLSVVILIREAAVVLLRAIGYPLVTYTPSGGTLAAMPDVFRGGCGLILALVLLGFAITGRSWARLSLGGVAVLSSLGTGVKAVPQLLQQLWGSVGVMPSVTVSVGLAAVGVVAGVLFMVLPPLRAFGWSQLAARDAIPVPVDDGSTPRRTLRRHQTVGERVVAVLSALGDGLIILVILALWALVYGADDWAHRVLAD